MSIQVDQLWIPDTLESDDAADFLAAVEVARRVRLATWGTDDLAYTPVEKLFELRDPYERQVLLAARLDGRIVGVADVSLPLMGDVDVAEFTLDILPEAQGHGVGRALVQAAEHFARSEGRRHLFVDTDHPAATLGDDQGSLLPDSGPGFVPLASRSVDFARRGGYTLERIEQFSSCALPLDSVLEGSLLAEADAANAGRYRLHHWRDRCPDEWLADMAALDSSAEDLTLAEAAQSGVPAAEWEDYDAEALRRAEDIAVAQGRRAVVTAVEHVESGSLVGVTTISVLPQRQDVVFQDETHVRLAHRGNKLGLLLKISNMQQLRDLFPDVRVIYTWNALENRYLLTVNQQLGFRTAGVTGLWQKQLPDLSQPNLT
ncbi:MULTISPECIES: GNAT family N-acetyltransferase [Arthrobacter]|uniref:GNAT family N-acetyltransferase n=2 Tax=Arthrobacter TaxID=1663 RepID=A0ABU9KPK1_9MICC|nr:GNAT family N-acetyltransferase [Arthrobacter sp. YJM1]MDP5228102.1 GNAT family N-acetyltransferase [Arthrobacter sp. YJM1]